HFAATRTPRPDRLGDRALGAGQMDLTAPEVLAGTVVAAGAALLPDIDHPSATIAPSAGAVSKLARAADSPAAGHRGATHTPLAVAVFALAGVLVTKVDWAVDAPVGEQIEIATTAVVTALSAFAVRALKLTTGSLAPWLIGAGAGLLVGLFAPEVSIWLPAAIGLGALVHLLGDLVTTDGIPFPTWPLV